LVEKKLEAVCYHNIGVDIAEKTQRTSMFDKTTKMQLHNSVSLNQRSESTAASDTPFSYTRLMMSLAVNVSYRVDHKSEPLVSNK